MFDRFAAREPFFAVVTDPRYLAARLTNDAQQRFFADGDAIINALYRTVSQHLDPYFAPSAILEYGCGVGRLALPLARRAAARGGSVSAVDRSPAMLQHARSHAEAMGLTNISFVEPAGLSTHEGFDLVICYLVLQRLPPAVGVPLMRSLVAKLLPGGIGAFQFPIGSRVSRSITLIRRMRAEWPLVNRLVRLARGDVDGAPFIPTYVYDFDEVMGVFRDTGIHASHVVFDTHGDVDSLIALVAAPADRPRRRGVEASEAPSHEAPALIDVRDVIGANSIEALNESADHYFASLETWEHHLAKPFASVDEAPSLLSDMAIVLRAAALAPGLTVLEFGAGTGWLSRSLTQLGCRAIVTDVSPTALEMAAALYARVPVVGDRPAPVFLRFDGRRFDLDDESIDRIICFHAFHHAANPDEVLAEFARVLRPGGIVAFAEPGPLHSRSAKSQFEMRSYRVVENDVDVHRVWEVARRYGFSDVRLFASIAQPLDLSLTDYADLARGGPVGDQWLAETRRHLRNTSNFALVKGGAAAADSRSAAGLSCILHIVSAPGRVLPGAPVEVVIRVTNSGRATWLQLNEEVGGVGVGWRIFGADGAMLLSARSHEPLTVPPRAITPGESVDVRVVIPGLAEGRYRVEFDCVAAGVTWFAQAGSRPAIADIDVVAAVST